MLKQGTFINKKFNKLFWGSIWGSLAYAINLMTDSLISGNQLGEISLQAVSIVYPLFNVVYFFSYLAPLGAAILYGKYVGEFRKDEANRAAGTSVTATIFIGILVSLALWLIKESSLAYFECTGALLREASAYYNWLIIFALAYPVSVALSYLCITDGDVAIDSAAQILNIVANVVLSYVLSLKYGISGLGMGTCIGELMSTVCYCVHFLKKTNSIKLRFCLDLKILKRSIEMSFSEYMYYLFLAVVDIVLNKIIIENCGMEYIPAYSVVNLVFSVCEVFVTLSSSSVGFITCFLGERNNHCMDIVLRKITRSLLAMSFAITGFFFFFAPLMPWLYGLETTDTVNASIFASRIMAFTALGFGINYISAYASNDIEKPLQACLVSFLGDVFSPLLLALVFGSLWGFRGIVIGMSLSTYSAFGMYALIQIPRKGKKGFPIYVDDFGEEGFSYDLRVTPDSLTELRDAIGKELRAHGYEIKNIDLLIEEFFTRVMEKNPGKSVIAECVLLFESDRVRIIIRDDGMLFNFIDENNAIESLNAHVLNSILEQTEQKNYLITTSFNRNGFVFEK